MLVSSPGKTAEYIERFHSDIEIRKNGDLHVTETIVVHAEGKQIRRGIYRDFPTRYEDDRGRNLVVGFEVLSVKRDGMREPYHIENRSNGKRVYIGSSNVYLKPGLYEYRLEYLTTRQLGFFDDFDELYWNVTGTGWAFRIDRASARVTLPGPVEEFRLTGYTGPRGSTAQNLSHRRLNGNSAGFQALAPLAPNEGLTIVAGFEKGLVEEPSAAQRRAWFIEDNKAALIIAGGALALLVYYLLLWHWFGRDPEAGVVVPLYRAPEGFSPASMRFIERMGYDKKCFTSAVVNLAAKGALEIDETGSNFKIRRLDADQTDLAPGEKQVLSGLFAGGGEIEIKQSNHSTLSKAISRHERSLELDYEKNYFKTNSWLLVPAVLASLAFVVLGVASLGSEDAIFKTIFLGVFTLMPLVAVYSVLRSLIRRGKKGFVRWGIFLVPMIIFFGFFFSAFPFEDFADAASIPVIVATASMILMHVLFYRWMKAPTLAGRRLLDKIDGFKHYLGVAEEDEIALRDAPTFTSDLYEAYLPYAIALDLENEWTARLDRAIAAGLVAQNYAQPRWYRSHGHTRGHFSSALSNSLNSAIASSSVAPGSSSGSSGGSSGGGGGGGGGGGW
jgi:uncharacterized membrane protein YgcG